MQEFNNHNSVFLLPFDIQNEKTGNNNTNDKYLIKNNSNLYNELETAKGFISYFFGDLIDTLILKDCGKAIKNYWELAFFKFSLIILCKTLWNLNFIFFIILSALSFLCSI